MANAYLQIATAMLRTGLLGYGGGPSLVPLIRYEAVTRYHWMEDDEFGEVLALANALPGPIATKLAAYVGYRQKGWLGALSAVLFHILPTCIAMVALLSFIQYFSTSSIIKGMISAVVPVVAVMLGTMAYEFGEKAVKGLRMTISMICFCLCFVLLEFMKIHPAVVIIFFLAYGAVHNRINSKLTSIRSKKENDTTWNG